MIAAAGALAVIRRAPPERRTVWQLAIVVAALVLAVVAWLSRARIIEIFSANSELTYRIQVWQRAWDLIDLSPLEGSGWIGAWQSDLPPFSYFASAGVREPASALNAYLDVWLQLGLVESSRSECSSCSPSPGPGCSPAGTAASRRAGPPSCCWC